MTLIFEFPPVNANVPYGPIDILPESSFELTITYPSASELIARSAPSRKLAWQLTEAQPAISFPAEVAHEDATYTLLMTDPDAPTPYDTKYSYWRHWIQPGLRPSSEPGIASTSDKEPLTEYLGPGKKDLSAEPHRYLFILLREPGAEHAYHSLTKSDVGAENFEARRAFDAKTWIEKYELKPVAIAWFWGSG